MNARNKISRKELEDVMSLREKIEMDMKYFLRELERVGWTWEEFQNRKKQEIEVND